MEPPGTCAAGGPGGDETLWPGQVPGQPGGDGHKARENNKVRA